MKIKKVPKSEKEQLRGKLRQAIKEIKKLKRRKSRDYSIELDSLEDNINESMDGPKDGLQCPKCGDVGIKVIELRGIDYGFCKNLDCDYAGKINK